MSSSQPQFIIAGAAKSGTTALCEYLGRDPQVFMTTPKELDFFLRERTEGDLKNYFNFFKEANGRVAGEGSVSYLSNSKWSAPQLKANFPDLKLIFMLRNPVDRYISDFWFYVAKGSVVNTPNLFDDILFGKKTLTLHAGKQDYKDYLIERGMYAKHLKEYMQHFDASQIYIIFFEDYIKKQEATIQSLYDFLGIANTHRESAVKQSNKTVYPGKLMPVYVMWKTVKKYLPQKLVANKQFKDKLLGVKALFFSNEKPKLNQAAREELKSIYKESIEDLELLLDKDLSHWKN